MKFQFNIDLTDKDYTDFNVFLCGGVGRLFGGIDNFRNFITYNTAAVTGQLGAGLSAARNLLRLKYKI